MASGSSTQKTLDRFRRTIEGGSYYEAQQVLKTVYHRLRARKQLQDSYVLLAEGSLAQLAAGQTTCGLELGQLLVEAYKTDEVAASPDTLQPLLSIIEGFGTSPATSQRSAASASGATAARDAADGSGAGVGGGGAATPLDQCCTFGTAAVRWVLKAGGPRDAQSLHDALAAFIWQAQGCRGLAAATPHFVRGSDMGPFARAVSTCAGAAPSEEEDLFVARAVLQLLATGAKSTAQQQVQRAQQFLERYEAATGHGLPDTPLANFLTLCLMALGSQQRSASMMRMLLELYSPTLAKDPVLAQLAARVEALHFERGGGGPLGGMLGDMLKMFSGGEE